MTPTPPFGWLTIGTITTVGVEIPLDTKPIVPPSPTPVPPSTSANSSDPSAQAVICHGPAAVVTVATKTEPDALAGTAEASPLPPSAAHPEGTASGKISSPAASM